MTVPTATSPIESAPIHENHEDNVNNNNKCNNKPDLPPYHEYCNILPVGIGFNRSILSQLDKNTTRDICNCVDENGVQISQAVARDTFGASKIEDEYYYHKVFTVHKGNDHIRNDIGDKNTNLNCDCNTRQFIKNIVAKK